MFYDWNNVSNQGEHKAKQNTPPIMVVGIEIQQVD
jgi:hypothetical protein